MASPLKLPNVTPQTIIDLISLPGRTLFAVRDQLTPVVQRTRSVQQAASQTVSKPPTLLAQSAKAVAFTPARVLHDLTKKEEVKQNETGTIPVVTPPAPVRPEGFTATQALTALGGAGLAANLGKGVIGALPDISIPTSNIIKSGGSAAQGAVKTITSNLPEIKLDAIGKTIAGIGAATIPKTLSGTETPTLPSISPDTIKAVGGVPAAALNELGNQAGKEFDNLYKYWRDRNKQNRYQGGESKPGHSASPAETQKPLSLSPLPAISVTTVGGKTFTPPVQKTTSSLPDLVVTSQGATNKPKTIGKTSPGATPPVQKTTSPLPDLVITPPRTTTSRETSEKNTTRNPSQVRQAEPASTGTRLYYATPLPTLSAYDFPAETPLRQDYSGENRLPMIDLTRTESTEKNQDENINRNEYPTRYAYEFSTARRNSRNRKKEKIRLDLDLPEEPQKHSRKKTTRTTKKPQKKIINPLPWLTSLPEIQTKKTPIPKTPIPKTPARKPQSKKTR